MTMQVSKTVDINHIISHRKSTTRKDKLTNLKKVSHIFFRPKHMLFGFSPPIIYNIVKVF